MNENLAKKKVPLRMCVACRQMREKKSLLRIVRAEDGSIAPDYKGRANGRGAYICRSCECLEKAIKIRAFERALGSRLQDEVIVGLMEEFSKVED